jgi:hypothetical protein
VVTDFGGTPITFWIDKTTRKLTRHVMWARPGVEILLVPRKPPSGGRRTVALRAVER